MQQQQSDPKKWCNARESKFGYFQHIDTQMGISPRAELKALLITDLIVK